MLTALERMKLRIGPECEDGARDALLELLLDDARAYVLAYTGRDEYEEMPGALIGAQVELALHQYNRRGIEGMSAATDGSVSQHVDSLPEHARRMMEPYRRARVIRCV